jgi:hypothetical protein
MALAASLLAVSSGAFAQVVGIPCEPGRFSASGFAPCSACPAGTFAAGEGSTTCTPCPPETFADSPGQSACQSAVVRWPTTAPDCDDPADLDACIESARDGGVVEIETHVANGQTVAVSGKSITLRPAPGFTPAFLDTTSLFFAGGDEDVTVSVHGLTLASGSIECRQGGEGTFRVTIRDNTIGAATGGIAGITVTSGNTQPPYGPTELHVDRNRVTVDGNALDSFGAIAVGPFEGGFNGGTVAGNRIQQTGGGDAPAIGVSNRDTSTSVDVLGNEITGSDFNAGILLRHDATGSLIARVFNNAVSGQADRSGIPAAIGIDVDDASIESSSFLVVNNTVAYGDTGLRLGGAGFDAGLASAIVANNLAAFNATGISLAEGGIVNEANLVFNDEDFFTPGAGTLFEDPLLVEDGLALRPDSPARDAGASNRVDASITTDIEGRARIIGPSVDIGAYEVPEPSQALAGAVALGALLRLRRRGRAP